MSILSPIPIGECMISTEIATLSSISAALSLKQDTLADAQIYAIDSVVSARATEMVFDDGAVSSFNWVDTVGIPQIARAGLRGDTGEWIRNPVAIKFGNAVTTLGYGVFGWCASLMSVIVSESTTRIGNFAFEECSSLNNVIVPESTTFIGTGAFNHCTNLTSIVFKGKSKQQIEAMPTYPWWGIENTSAISTWNDASQEFVESKLSGYVQTSAFTQLQTQVTNLESIVGQANAALEEIA